MVMKELLLAAVLAVVVRGNDVTTPGCIEPGQGIVVGFELDNNRAGDWVGLFPAGSTTSEPRGNNWVWTCGTQGCGVFPQVGPVMMPAPNLAGSSLWVAVVARWENGKVAPYTIVETSAPFIVKNDCSTPPPTPSPTPNPTFGVPQPSASPTTARPTPVPTPSPTATPTTPPPTSFTQAPTAIRTNKASYVFAERFSVEFEIDDPRQGDWVGIYDASVPLDNLHVAHFWLWVCDNQGNGIGCNGRSSGTIVFREDKQIAWSSSWALDPGQYRAVFMRNGSSGPWQVIDASPVFTIETPSGMGEASIAWARNDIKKLIDADVELGAKFLRLGFHDCVGGCDGCVDMTFIDNRGLDAPIDALEPVWQKHKALFSRADIWAMATLVGPEVAQPNSGFRKDFGFSEFGRRDCEDVLTACFNEDGEQHECSVKRGPFHHIPGVNTGTHELFEFFKDEFGFNTRETVAIMGAHTLGQLARENSGIGGENGWLLHNELLDNEYYIELVGGDGPNDRLENHIEGAPNWLRHFESNSDLSDFPDKHVWLGLPEGIDGRRIIMLNTDIAIVRDLNDDNMDPITGQVDCNFVDRTNTRDSRCPHAQGALQEAVRYRFSNQAWLNDFEDVIIDMLRNGYTVDESTCVNGICELDPV